MQLEKKHTSFYNNLLKNKEISFYIHWPFCDMKCPYCDFNSYFVKIIEFQKWEKAFIKEVNRACNFFKESIIKTLFFVLIINSYFMEGNNSNVLFVVTSSTSFNEI